MTVAWARVVPGLAAQREPQGGDQHPQGRDQPRLPLVFQPVFTAESSGGSPPRVSAEELTSRLLCTPPPLSELLLSHQEDDVRKGSTGSKISGRLVHSPAQLSLDKSLAMGEQTCS